MPNIFPVYVNIYNLNHVILVRNKCHQKIKIKIYLNKDVHVLLFINGQIHLIVIPYKLDYLKMLKLMIKVYKDMVNNFIIPKFMRKLELKWLLVYMLYWRKINIYRIWENK